MVQNRSLLRRARIEPTAVELNELMPEGFDLMSSIFSDTVPDWLVADLECEGLLLRLERLGHWILASLDE
ncbi:hypothetical protein SG18_02090 [Pandoraea apista]|nr:hypothetical protein SG18_02090 [Pandoraea apista]AKH71223.1 hypothetical protein XM39_02090 [Pandoraea apista]AKI63495.1 hypothetical protein AA956_19410 [Pandoraea apista]